MNREESLMELLEVRLHLRENPMAPWVLEILPGKWWRVEYVFKNVDGTEFFSRGWIKAEEK